MERIYEYYELKSGTCSSCLEYSNEILKSDGRCIDCIEEEKFIDESLHIYKEKNPE
jgi:hypothetical protein